MKGLLVAAALFLPAFALPAQANCSGSWGSYGYNGSCSGYSSGGSYRLNVNGYGNSPANVNGNSNGSPVRGTIDSNGSFRGTVNGRYTTCGSWGCN